MKIVKIIGIFLLVGYLLLCVGLYFGQNQVLFKPKKLSEDHQFPTGQEVEIPVAEGISLNCLSVKEANSKGVILYLHGNKGSIRRCLRQAQTMSGNQYDLFLVDYRGYGKSDGQIVSEAQLFKDVQTVYGYLKKQYREDQIQIVGYSLGSGMASWLAAHNSPKRLLLVAPYVSFIDLKNHYIPFVPNFLVKFPLNNKAHLAAVKCPVTLFHGTNDEVIPFVSSKKLVQVDPTNIQLVTLEGESHRGAIFNNVFRSTVRRILK